MTIALEEKVYWNNGSLKIEGLLGKHSEESGVVICHPHPLMGGSMHNNVVEAIRDAFALQNYTTLRFNFRGAGNSTGNYDEGRGEQEDILSAQKFLKNNGTKKIFLAGYSFGAWVGSKVLEQSDQLFVAGILVSPPHNLFDFNWENMKNKIDLLVSGDRDQYCDAEVLRKRAKMINSPMETIYEADHFYSGKEKELIDLLLKYIVNYNEKNVKKSLILKKMMLKFTSISASRIFIRENVGGFC
jgi:alpha/beta superfamily hydrolase